jgi:hypothetical protein
MAAEPKFCVATSYVRFPSNTVLSIAPMRIHPFTLMSAKCDGVLHAEAPHPASLI